MKKLLFVMVAGILALGAGSVMADNTIEVLAEAAMEGNFGLKGTIDQGALNVAYVQSDHPQTESHFKVSFWVDATGLDLPVTPAENKCFVFMKMYRDNPSPKQHTFVYLCRNNADTAWRIAVMTRKDSLAWTYVGGTFLSNDTPPQPQFIEVEFQQSTGANDGFVKLFRNGSLAKQRLDLNNDQINVDQVRVGFPPGPKLGSLAQGYYYFDSYVSMR
jgi:hypothetical protein